MDGLKRGEQDQHSTWETRIISKQTPPIIIIIIQDSKDSCFIIFQQKGLTELDTILGRESLKTN